MKGNAVGVFFFILNDVPYQNIITSRSTPCIEDDYYTIGQRKVKVAVLADIMRLCSSPKPPIAEKHNEYYYCCIYFSILLIS